MFRSMLLMLLVTAATQVFAGDYDFAKLVNYDFATTRDVARVEAKIDTVASKVDALATEVGSLKTFIETMPKPAIAKEQPAESKSHGRIVVVSDGRPEIDLKLSTAFRALRDKDTDWTIGRDPSNVIQFVNRHDGLAVDQIKAEACLEDSVEFPLIAYIEDGEVVRRWAEGCTTPLDAWTFGWLQTGTDKRPSTVEPEKATVARSGRYPLTGGWWSVEGHWNPSKGFIVDHLLSGGQHSGRRFNRDWLESLSYAELQSVHTDDHTGRLKTAFVNAPLRTIAAIPVKAAAVTTRAAVALPVASTRIITGASPAWVTFPQARSSCPNGVCPLQRTQSRKR